MTTNGVRHWLLRDLPYAAMLALAVGGIVLTSFRGPTTYYYWMALAPIYGLICVVAGWRQLDTGAGHMQLVVTQALHWFAFVGAMWLMFLPQVRGVVSDNATSLTLLILLALGTFVAGVHAGSGASALSASFSPLRCRPWPGSRNRPCCCWSAPCW